jgi:hypothetical protein
MEKFTMYNVVAEVEKSLIKTQLEGFWSQSDFERFMADEQAALAQLRCGPGKHILLCDLTKLNVVSQEMGALIGKELNSEGPRDAAWIAIVITSALLKMQIQRLLTRPNAIIFDNETDAMTWLLGESGYTKIKE